MFIELVEQLRCIRDHEEGWLVASFDRMDGRSVIAGTLGCPSCGAEYPIVDGIAWFGAEPEPPRAAEARAAVDQEETLRLAAMLGLVGAGGTVLLCGGWGAHADALVELAQVNVLLVDPPAGIAGGQGTGIVRTGSRVPVGAGLARGAAVDDVTAALAAPAARTLRAKGRLVAPAALPPVEGMAELARDERHWVAERAAAPSAPVPLRLSRRG